MRFSASIRRPADDFCARRSWAAVGAGARTKTARMPRYRCARATCKMRRWRLQEIYYPVLVERQQLPRRQRRRGKISRRIRDRSLRCACCATHLPISMSSGSARRRGDCSAANAARRPKRWSSRPPEDPGAVADQEAQLSIEAGRQRDFFYRRRRRLRPCRGAAVRIDRSGPKFGYVSKLEANDIAGEILTPSTIPMRWTFGEGAISRVAGTNRANDEVNMDSRRICKRD